MNKEILETKIADATSRLINTASDLCWNTISRNCFYLLSEIDETIGKNLFEGNKIRKKINEGKTPKSLQEITQDLALLYDNLYDINFYIYKASKDKTIIEIKYFLKTSHTKDFYETIKDNNPMWHGKVAIPPYLSSIGKPAKEEKKFDVNWQLGGIRYEWNLFLYRFKYYVHKTRYNYKKSRFEKRFKK
ncbi:hypothetical protein FIA58_002060 [Flavobacterium jejuense]|uniref:Uncharacterized protein n=1 Tax=Flavobacterium jejuense TaxID=1544455 RepID=A0ABX0INB3_9FLAO|nr:hypothetical protein [Flavobacterium jejuense]NHN24447.1 hypothetical protein [Flavobacterium jejuense]